jgi:hypothetical protein
MDEPLWETPVCWLCDYWWAVLSAIVLVLAAYFSRSYWLPLVGLESSPVVSATPVSSGPAEFSDPGGEYSFSPPESWPAADAGDQTQQWALPDGVVMSVHSDPSAAGETLEDFASEVTTRLPYDVISQTETQLGGQPAIRQEVAYPGNTSRVALGYLVLYDGNKYQIALAGLEEIPADEQQKFIQDFENAMTTFEFK